MKTSFNAVNYSHELHRVGKSYYYGQLTHAAILRLKLVPVVRIIVVHESVVSLEAKFLPFPFYFSPACLLASPVGSAKPV